jgi:magnesium-transporting ATPase (P-type)
MTFIPKAMFEQFRRMANIYFLVLGIIAFVAEQTNYYATSVEASGLLLPMLLVVMISMVKDGYEDYKRHSSDAKIAAKEARQITSDGNVVPIEWKDLAVGSVILLLCV